METKPVVLIAGITSGIGSDLAKRLDAAGWQVAGYNRNAEKREALKASLPNAFLFECDATNPEQVEAAFITTSIQFGQIDAYVHCIGSIFLRAAALTTTEDWLKTINLNLNSAFYGLKGAVTQMQKQPQGSIILVSSAVAQVGLTNHEAIAAAKAGIDGLVRAAAATYAPKNIRINAIAPALVDTPLAASILATEQGRAAAEKMVPLGRIGRPDNISGLMQWLLSKEADWVTGQIYTVDGGLAHLRSRPKS